MLTIKGVSGSVTHSRKVEPVYFRDSEIEQLKLLIATGDGLSIVSQHYPAGQIVLGEPGWKRPLIRRGEQRLPLPECEVDP